MSLTRKTSKVTNGHGCFHSSNYADDGDLAEAGNGSRPLIAAFDTGIRLYQEERDVGEQGPMEKCDQPSGADCQGHRHGWRSGSGWSRLTGWSCHRPQKLAGTTATIEPRIWFNKGAPR